MDIREWLNVALPLGKGSLIMYSLYADESSTDAAGLLTIAGYLIGSKALVSLTEAWATALGPLEYFHMSEGHYRAHPDIYHALLGLMTSDHLVVGFAASVNQTEYKRVMGQKLHGRPLRYWFGGSYSFCVTAIAYLANKWLDANNPEEQDLAYVFEAGHASQGEADTFLHMINRDRWLADQRRILRYFSHTFMDGKRKESGALQAADILAWHITTAIRDAKPREECRILSESVQLWGVHYPESAIRENVHRQLEFCNFYGDLKGAKELKI